MHLLRLLRKYPVYAIFLLSEAISLAGDWFGVVAVSVLALQQGAGSGAFAVGVTLALHDLPMAFVRPFAGVLADRFDRRTLLLAVHVVQGLLTVGMTVAAAAGALWVVQALILVRSLVAGFDWPARSGALRRLVDEADLLDANSLGGVVWSSAFALGMSLGGWLTARGPTLALAIDAASFFVGALLLLALPALPTRGAESLGYALRKVVVDLREAAAAARASPELFEAVLAKAPFGVAGGAGVVLMNVVADTHPFAGSGPATLGLLQALRGVGTGLLPLVTASLVRRGAPLWATWVGVAACAFSGMALFGATTEPWVLVCATLLWGGGIGSNWMLASSELQRRASDGLIGRMSGLDIFLVELSFGLSALAGGWVYEPFGAVGALGGSIAIGVALWVVAHGVPVRMRAAG